MSQVEMFQDFKMKWEGGTKACCDIHVQGALVSPNTARVVVDSSGAFTQLIRLVDGRT